MRRDIAIAALLLLAGFLLGISYRSLSGPATHLEAAEDLAGRIEAAEPLVEAEATEESSVGPVVYVHLRKSNPRDDYVPVARVEIGYEGQLLPSLWPAGSSFYEYHFNRSMEEADLLHAIGGIARQKAGGIS